MRTCLPSTLSCRLACAEAMHLCLPPLPGELCDCLRSRRGRRQCSSRQDSQASQGLTHTFNVSGEFVGTSMFPVNFEHFAWQANAVEEAAGIERSSHQTIGSARLPNNACSPFLSLSLSIPLSFVSSFSLVLFSLALSPTLEFFMI